jgi:hypothetical protein
VQRPLEEPQLSAIFSSHETGLLEAPSRKSEQQCGDRYGPLRIKARGSKQFSEYGKKEEEPEEQQQARISVIE